MRDVQTPAESGRSVNADTLRTEALGAEVREEGGVVGSG
jgi:hypothetical protein